MFSYKPLTIIERFVLLKTIRLPGSKLASFLDTYEYDYEVFSSATVKISLFQESYRHSKDRVKFLSTISKEDLAFFMEVCFFSSDELRDDFEMNYQKHLISGASNFFENQTVQSRGQFFYLRQRQEQT